MKTQFGKYGPKQDYTGAYVCLMIGERQYLGNIISIYRNEVRGMTLAKVRHFNGEYWPFEPALSALEILEHSV